MATSNTVSLDSSLPPINPTDPANIGGIQSYDTYMNLAGQQLNPTYNTEVNAVTAAGNKTASDYGTLATQVLNQQPLVQQTYSNLLDELSSTYKTDTANATAEQKNVAQTGTANTGAAIASQAQGGAESATGRANANVTSAQNTATYNNALETNKVNALADKYGLDQQKLQIQLQGSVQQLQNQAAQYTMQGDEASANLASTLASLADTHQQQIDSLTQQMYSSATTMEQTAWNNYIGIVKIDQAQQRLDITAAHYSAMESAANTRNDIATARLNLASQTPSMTQNSSGGYEYTNKSGQPITAVDYAKQTGQSLTSILGTDQGSKDFINMYNNLNSQLANETDSTQVSLDKEKANSLLKQKFGYIVGTNNVF